MYMGPANYTVLRHMASNNIFLVLTYCRLLTLHYIILHDMTYNQHYRCLKKYTHVAAQGL